MTDRTITTPVRWDFLLILLGLAASSFIAFQIDDRILNVVTYELAPEYRRGRWLSWVVALFTPCVAVVLSRLRRRVVASIAIESAAFTHSLRDAVIALLLVGMVGSGWSLGYGPAFISLCLAVAGLGWYVEATGRGVLAAQSSPTCDRLCFATLLFAALVTVTWHTFQQFNYLLHFRLGYADVGFFVTELEHCIPWKAVGAARFSDTRMGYHCIPMFYLLAPFYAWLRSPIFLMAVGAVVIHLPAIMYYRLARSNSRSSIVALFVGLGWLLLPSVSRLPYANTYGFQSIYLAVPFLAACFIQAALGRWKASHVFLILALLCEETVCGIAFGWGLYLILFGNRRKDGCWIIAGSILYLLLCTTVIIPFFASTPGYSRLALFGEWNLREMLVRLTRERSLYFVVALTIPLWPGLVRSWKPAVAAAPTLLLVLLMKDHDYLNVKYWHQTSLLPLLYFAAVQGVTTHPNRALPDAAPVRLSLSVSLFISISLFHVLMGFSPVSRAGQLQSFDGAMHLPDRRMETVLFIKETVPPDDTIVIATERMAAHFTEYRMVHTLSERSLTANYDADVILILDAAEEWDPEFGREQIDGWVRAARSLGFELVHEERTVRILRRPAPRQSSPP